jgi:hypothetical protein
MAGAPKKAAVRDKGRRGVEEGGVRREQIAVSKGRQKRAMRKEQ